MKPVIEFKRTLPSPQPVIEWVNDAYIDGKITYQEGDNAKSELNCDFGNPHSVIDGFTSILRQTAIPPSSEQGNYYSYRMQKGSFNSGFVAEREYISQRLNKESATQYPWKPEHILMTTGAVSGLYISISLLTNTNDEVVYFAPYWFEYSAMIEVNGAIPKPLLIYNENNVLTNQEIIKKIENSINSKTKLIVLNTPHNPSGVMFNDNEWQQLANILNRKSQQFGRRIFVICDEAYRDFVYENKYVSLTQYYPFSIIIYTYGKILLAPQQRLGWIAISPLLNHEMSNELYNKLDAFLIFSGWQIPNVIPGKGLISMEKLIDKLKGEKGLMNEYKCKRDLIVNTLLYKCFKGYKVTISKGTFYLLFKPPNMYNMNGYEYCKGLIQRENTRLLPGYTTGLKGWIRVTYTAPMEKIKLLCDRLIGYDKYLQRYLLSKL
eukprot:454217_1